MLCVHSKFIALIRIHITVFFAIQETYGEDPYLSGVLARHFVKGLQGDHPRYLRTGACCKHFDVHGGPENIPSSRFSFDAKVVLYAEYKS